MTSDSITERAAREARHARYDDGFGGWSDQSDAHDDGFAAGAAWALAHQAPATEPDERRDLTHLLNLLVADLEDMRMYGHAVSATILDEARAIRDQSAEGKSSEIRFTAEEVIQIANETSDTFGNLYRIDFINRIQHEAQS